MMNRLPILLIFVLACPFLGSAQQVADTTSLPEIKNPAFSHSAGPVVMIDEAHNNFHTATGRYLPFAKFLKEDGYQVKPNTLQFSLKNLSECDILVISNAIHESNLDNWTLPTPSAFTEEEIIAVREWIRAGGALLLIADHMPMPGAAAELAAEFGVQLNNGFAFETKDGEVVRRPIIFRRSDGTLADHPITNGRNRDERIDFVATFTGQAFQSDDKAAGLLFFREHSISLMPKTAWQFEQDTERVLIGGWFQGVAKEFDKGRVAIFGEAAMFTAQRQGAQGRPMGMNTEVAAQNPQFLLNVMHWLSGLL